MVSRDREQTETETNASIAKLAAQADDLRKLVLGEDTLELLDKIDRDIVHNDRRVKKLSDDLPEALLGSARQGESKYQELIHSMRAPVEDSLDSSVQIDKRRLAQVLSPVLGGMITRYLSAFSSQMMEAINLRLASVASVTWWRTMISAKLRGVPVEEISGAHLDIGRLEEVLVLNKDRSVLIAHHSIHQVEAETIDGMGAGFEELLEKFGDEPTESLASDAFTWRLKDGRLGLISGGSHCHVLGLGCSGSDPSLGREVQGVCDIVDELLDPKNGLSQDAEVTPEQRLGASEAAAQALEVSDSAKPDPSEGPAKLLLWALLSLVIVGLGLQIWGNVRWSGAIAALEAEPGIRVLEHHRGLGGSRVHVLRDPLAVGVDSVLAGQGYSDNAIEVFESAFYCQEPQFAEERSAELLEAKRKIEALEGSQVTLRDQLAISQDRLDSESSRAGETVQSLREEMGDSLATALNGLQERGRDRDLVMLGMALDLPKEVEINRQDRQVQLAGKLETGLRERLLRSVGRIDWVDGVDASSLVVSDQIEEIAVKIRKVRIRFVDSQTELLNNDDPGLAKVVELVKESRDTGLKTKVRLVGVPLRGSADRENAKVALRRCEVIRGRLVDFGIPNEWFEEISVAEKEALPGYDGVYIDLISDRE